VTLTQTDLRMSIRGTIYRDVIHDSLLSNLWSSSRRLDYSMRDLSDDERVNTMMRSMRSIRWRLSSIPLPTNHPQLEFALELSDFVQKVSDVARIVGRNSLVDLNLVVDALQEINSNPTSSLFDQVIENLVECDDEGAIVVIQERRFIDSCVQEFMNAGMPFSTVMRPDDLRDAKVGTTQVIVGISSALPDWIFTSPSAEILTLVHFDIGRDREKIQGLLDNRFTFEIKGSPQSIVPLPEFSRDEILRPERDWRSVRGAISVDSLGSQDLLPARAFAVAGGNFILLACEGDETCRIVRTNGDRAILKRVLVRDVTDGDYLVIRTDGGRSDVIAEIADEILGSRAELLRQLQLSWTSRLRDYIQANGRGQTQLDLKKYGCKAQNVDQWARGVAIRPQSDGDFSAVLHICGMKEAEMDHYFEGMLAIRSAHIKAGHLVAKELEGSIEELDTRALSASGFIELRLEESDVRPMGLFRVEEAETTTAMSRINTIGVLTLLGVK